jgi:hypothetical protein
MRHVFALALLATLASPAAAQGNLNAGQKTPLQLQTERQEEEQRENERQYNQTMKRLKAQAPAATSRDPWRKVRPPSSDATAKR